MAIDYIGFYTEYVEDLKKEGKQYLGWCPFHEDKGSKRKGFSVNEDNGLWKCFSPSCNAKGNDNAFCKKRGIDIKEAPGYDPNYQQYSYGAGIAKMKPTPEAREKGKHDFWAGTKGEGLPDDMKPYSYQAIDQARELGKTLWICEGEKDTETMFEAGELAIGIPSANTDKVLNGVSLDGIPKVIICCDNDDAGRKATEKIKDRFPFANIIVWPSHYPSGWDVTDTKEECERLDLGHGFVGQLKQFVRRDTWEDEAEVVDSFLTGTTKGTDFIETGFSKFDAEIDGLLPGGLHVIQGSSSIGKTTFCKQLADQVHVKNPQLPIFFFALEDSLQTIRTMTFSRLSHDAGLEKAIENRAIRKGGSELTGEDYKTLREIASKVKEIYGQDYYLVAGESDINVRTVRERVERKLNRIGKSTAFVIVDYLQILPTPKEERLGSLMDKIDFNLHELQCLARDINGPVILTSSTTKEDIKTTVKDRTPGQTKGKGSANILYTPRMLLELIEGEDVGMAHREVKLYVLKNSEGPRDGIFSFEYLPRYSKFSEEARGEHQGM